jgi:hypothetical protein
MKTLRILFTNNELDLRGGSELVILDLAKEFQRRGHLPIAYSRRLGVVAKTLRDACIPVISDLNLLGSKPDIIHGQHHVEAMSAMLHFPDVPAIYVCHGWLPWQEKPPIFSNIQKYLAVGRQTRESIVTNCGVPSEEIEIISNFVDIKKFQLKKNFNGVPQSALILDNNVTPKSGYVECVKTACAKAGIEKVDIVGRSAGNSIDNLHSELPKYDLVFALGRSALEAMSVGCSVIIASPFGAQGLVTSENVEQNFMKFGIASLKDDLLNTSFLHSEILKYNTEDSIKVANWIRKKADLCLAASRYESVYYDAINRWENLISHENRYERLLKEASRYIENLKPLLNEDQLRREILIRKSLINKLKVMGINVKESNLDRQ